MGRAGLEHELEELYRNQVSRAELPFGLVWLLPSGRFISWFVSALLLALLVTELTPVGLDDSLLDDSAQWGGLPDLLLLLYTVGWAHGELTDIEHDIRRYGSRGGVHKYLRDHFNFLDLLMVVLLVDLMGVRALAAYYYALPAAAPANNNAFETAGAAAGSA